MYIYIFFFGEGGGGVVGVDLSLFWQSSLCFLTFILFGYIMFFIIFDFFRVIYGTHCNLRHG